MDSKLNLYPVGTHLVHWTNKRVKRRIIAYEGNFVWLAFDSGNRDSAVRVPVDALERCYKEVRNLHTEKTCRNIGANQHEFKCSECGVVWCIPDLGTFWYCPYCGAKVVG